MKSGRRIAPLFVLAAMLTGGWVWHSDSTDESLAALLRVYHEQVIRVDPIEGFSRDDALDWIQRFEDAIDGEPASDDRQLAMAVVMSLWNWLEEWDLAHATCQRALSEATDDATRLERLLDRFAIENARDAGRARLAEGDGDPRLATYAEAQKLLDRLDSDGRSLVLHQGRLIQYVWVAENAAKIAEAEGQADLAARIASRLAEILREDNRGSAYDLDPIARQNAGRAAGALLVSGDLRGAVRAITGDHTAGDDAVLMTTLAYRLASRSGAVPFRNLHHFLLAVGADDTFRERYLQLLMDHTHECLIAIARAKSPENYYQPTDHADGVAIRDVIALVEQQISLFEREVGQEALDLGRVRQQQPSDTVGLAYQSIAKLYGVMGEASEAERCRQQALRLGIR